ncbi:hypothetical protein V6N12_044942 [Hibiscus sabdariffa]|uniref:RRM domain-containing protein n=1 Tax=Hibiscus sabdariffa TaxID=183260 RepID=A0ABR2G1U8_9ROSI
MEARLRQRSPKVTSPWKQGLRGIASRKHGNFRRGGFVVFVNNVSKRIHQSTLKEAFADYGTIIDVYIAYNSRKRVHRGDTFAFFRYETSEEVARAIELGNGRRVDGYTIKCFWGHRKSDPLLLSRDRPGKPVSSTPRATVDYFKMTNGRSYREVLLLDEARSKGKTQDSGILAGKNQGTHKEEVDFNLYHFTIQQNDLVWLRSCLVGQIKGGDAENWFDDINSTENFISKCKLKIWVSLENVPLVAWNNGIFKAIANKWGRLIKIDEDTISKNIFECARFLIEVEHKAIVPHNITLFINGKPYCVKVSISDYEDEKVWIDSSHHEELVGTRIETVLADNTDNIVAIADMYIIEGPNVVAKNFEVITRKIKKNEGSSPNPTEGIIRNSDLLGQSTTLYDVHVNRDLNVSINSESSSESRGPNLDCDTGLFVIKPRYVKSAHGLISSIFNPCRDLLHRRVDRGKLAYPRKLEDSRPKCEGANTGDTSKSKLEAEITLKMANGLSIRFGVPDEVVLEQISNLETLSHQQ